MNKQLTETKDEHKRELLQQKMAANKEKTRALKEQEESLRQKEEQLARELAEKTQKLEEFEKSADTVSFAFKLLKRAIAKKFRPTRAFRGNEEPQ